MENIINLGGKDYNYKINFKLSYDFLKYRNRIQSGFDISNVNKDVAKEIIEMQDKVQKMQEEIKSGKKKAEDFDEFDLIDGLSPEAKKFFQEISSQSLAEKFTAEEIEDIVKKLTNIEDEEELLKILDYEVENVGYDDFVGKLIEAIAKVFSVAKAN
jgi:hypothetical protein